MRPKILLHAAIATVCLLVAGMAPLRAAWGLIIVQAPWGFTIVQAQSLADLAREEEARRKEIKRPAKVYTNKDLVNVSPPSAPAPASTDASKPAPGTQPTAPAVTPEGEDAATDTAGDAPHVKPQGQAYWSGKMKKLSEQLDRDRILNDALQTRINALTADFSARDDPAQRRLIGLDRQKALDELDRIGNSILDDQKAIADFQEEARRLSVPPGWLR